jgi:hypothetical protein
MPKSQFKSEPKKFSILSNKSIEEIKNIVRSISDSLLTETSHDYINNKGKTIGGAAKLSSNNYSLKAVQNPAMALAEVVLAANRNYLKVVEPKIKAAQSNFPDIRSFDSLLELMKKTDWKQFEEFWGHRDQKKYNTLKSILNEIVLLRKKYPDIKGDYELMHHWAIQADLQKYTGDPIGKLPNVAVATFQHLRMVFGKDTIKPDQRVKEVLDYEFSAPILSDINAITAIEEIAQICKLGVLEVDQIFVNYGSGYYNRTGSKLTAKDIAKKLKERKVDDEIIIYATGLSQYQLSKI